MVLKILISNNSKINARELLSNKRINGQLNVNVFRSRKRHSFYKKKNKIVLSMC